MRPNHVLSLFSVLALAFAPACSSPTTTDAGMDAAQSDGALNEGGASGDAAADAQGPSACQAYCTSIQTVCTGSNSQYADQAACLAACGSFAPGTPGATSGNTLACRAYHLGVAAMPGMAATHCPHAGLSGGGVCVN